MWRSAIILIDLTYSGVASILLLSILLAGFVTPIFSGNTDSSLFSGTSACEFEPLR
jgi:hypothetical protein